MSRKLIVLGTCIVSLGVGAFAYQQRSAETQKEVSADVEPDSVRAHAGQSAACADDSYAWQRVRELEEEIARLKKASSAAAVHENPQPDVSAQASEAVAEVPAQTSAAGPLAGTVPTGTSFPQSERDITNSNNSEDEDRALLKKLDLRDPKATIMASRQVPDEKIHQLKGAYQGKLFFTKGSVGSMELSFNLDESAGKNAGTLNARIINAEGKAISNTRSSSNSIDLKKGDGSDALLMKLSPFEVIQIFVKEDKASLVGNYYERADADEPLKKTGEFILSKVP